MNVTEEKLITSTQAKKILEKKAKDKELGYEQKNALEYLKRFSKLSDSKIKDLMGSLEKIEKLKEKHIINIVNYLPQNIDDVKLLFAHEITSLSEDDMKKVASLVKKHTS